MKKKMLAVLLAGAMVASLTACGGSNSADTADTTKTEESGDSAEAADTKDASEFKVGLITDVSLRLAIFLIHGKEVASEEGSRFGDF